MEEETARRVEEAVRKRVDEALTGDSFLASLKSRIDLERKSVTSVQSAWLIA